jgi:hypothetical protein
MTDFDPTTNRIPFKLMTGDERAALYAWPHGWEYFGVCGWEETPEPVPSWFSTTVYRGKPAPVVTSVWQNIYVRGACESRYRSRESADKHSGGRIGVLRIDTCNGVSTPHLEEG